MKKTLHSPWFGFLPVMLLFCSFISCSSTEGIDNYFTFNLDKSFTVAAPAGSAVWPAITLSVPVGFDSTDLAKNGTSLSLVKSVKLTKLIFTSSDASIPFSNVDTFTLSIADNEGSQLLADYSGAKDSMYLSNADFAKYITNKITEFKASVGYQKVPATTVTYTGNYTLVFTAKPKE